MQFELTVSHNGITVQLSSATAPDVSKLNEFLNSLTSKAIQQVQPTVVKRRGRPAGAKNKK